MTDSPFGIDTDVIVETMEEYPGAFADCPDCPECGLPMLGQKMADGPWCPRCDA